MSPDGAEGRPPAQRPRASRPDCLRCRHYFVTHEPGRPHGCRRFAFRSLMLPSLEVYRSSGLDCQAYEPRRT